MKICRFEYQNQVKTGVYEPEYGKIIDDETKEVLEISDVKMLLPTVPSKIVCVGRNYAEHAAELGNEVPKEPLLFLKAPSALITDGENIVIPPQSNQVEHEGELAIVIGNNCKNLSENDNPFDYVLGYTCLNDVTARDVQRKDVQFTRGKSFDTFCPILNYLETELDVSDIRVQTFVNKIVKQDGKTSQMVFPVDFLIRYISNQMTLNAGDIIATGTPSGVSKMVDGDICEVEIEGIGVLRNPVKG
jgi:2-keto-4-pentenoate hydratase/2-oxohepta-3-ene-1,7-dioic acid hydratase in catechol pathway